MPGAANQRDFQPRMMPSLWEYGWTTCDMLFLGGRLLRFLRHLLAYLEDDEGAIELLAAYFEQANLGQIEHAEVDPDMNRLRVHPRFLSMVAAARARLEMAVGPEAVGPKDA